MQVSTTCILLILALLVLSGCTVLSPNKYPKNTGNIILTFDDGPSNEISSKLLDILAETETKAVFCYIGENIAAYPEITTRAINEGHMIVMHTYSHTLESLLSASSLEKESELYFKTLESLPTRESKPIQYFRPPLGIKTPAVKSLVKKSDYKYAHVTFFINDAKTEAKDSAALMKKIKEGITKNNGGAVVLHEMRFKAGRDKYEIDRSWLPAAVKDLIQWAKSNGYNFILYPEP